MSDNFQRLKVLIGAENFSKLTTATVAVFGIGGVGSFAAEQRVFYPTFRQPQLIAALEHCAKLLRESTIL